MFHVHWPCREFTLLLRIMEYNVMLNWPYIDLPILIWIMGKDVLCMFALHKIHIVITFHGTMLYKISLTMTFQY